MCPAPAGVMRARCRWPCRMAQLLGEGYEVVAEGLSGRTTVFSDYIEPYRAGIEQIVPIVQSHAPDALVVMLGTNDTKTRYHVCAQEIGYGMEELLLRLRTACPFSPAPKVVLVSPAPLRCKEGIEFSPSSVEKSKELAPIYAGIAGASAAAISMQGNLPSWVRTASISRRRTTPKWPAAPRRPCRRCSPELP